jgi:hypothetical protein
VTRGGGLGKRSKILGRVDAGSAPGQWAGPPSKSLEGRRPMTVLPSFVCARRFQTVFQFAIRRREWEDVAPCQNR